MATYMVRAYEDQFNEFFDNDVVAVGWSYVNFSVFNDTERLVDEVIRQYDYLNNLNPSTRGRTLNQIRRFKSIQKGDKILVPYYSNVCLAEALGEEIFKQEIQDSQDQSNQHKVNFHRDQNANITSIPRYNLSEGLQRRLKMPGGIVVDLGGFADEIEFLFQGYDFDASFDKKRNDEIVKFKRILLEKIKSGKTLLQTGGVGLEQLVQKLLEFDGYNARIQGKSNFPGFADADIIATKEDRFSPNKLLVQVKHHEGITDSWGAKQLLGIIESNKDFFSEYTLVLVTSAEPAKELIDTCEKHEIVLYSGNDLADWIFESLPKMDFATKKKLYLSDIPIIIS